MASVRCKIFVLFFLCVNYFSIIYCQVPTVQTPVGRIQGKTKTTYTNVIYESFEGIPYAQPPVGNLRFANPVKALPFTDTYKALNVKDHCPQRIDADVSEDCLYLNIYRPLNLGPTSLLPVIVHFYNGNFVLQAASALSPDLFINNGDTIFVSLDYRIGALGYLSTGDENSPGNFGLKDQVKALKWIKKNILAFGGNPNSVTLMGRSHSAHNINMHMMSPLSKGLFHRAVLRSGTALTPFFYPTRCPLKLARLQAKVLGIANADVLSPAELIDALRLIGATTIAKNLNLMKYKSFYPLIVYRPVIEKESRGAFITKSIQKQWKSGHFNQVPMIFTFTSNEGVLNNNFQFDVNDINANFNDRILRIAEVKPKTTADAEYIVQTIKNFYFNGSSDVTYSNGQGLADMLGDREFYHPIYNTIMKFIRHADPYRAPVAIYRFDFESPTETATFLGNNFNLYHGVDDDYLYNAAKLSAGPAVDIKMAKRYVETITYFAKFGIAKQWVDTPACRPVFQYPHNKYDIQPMCAYQQFTLNKSVVPNDITVKLISTYPMEAMRFWNSILKFGCTGQPKLPV